MTEIRDLIEDVKKNHHDFLYKELPRLLSIVKELAVKHRFHCLQVDKLTMLFERFVRDFFGHMNFEENVIFPLLNKMCDGAGDSKTNIDEQTLKKIVQTSQEDHLIEAELTRIKHLVKDALSATGDTKYSEVSQALDRVAENCKVHVFKETERLFPVLKFYVPELGRTRPENFDSF